MHKPQQQVEQFMREAGQKIEVTPSLAKDYQVLRHKLIEEELYEYRQACFEGNLVEIADALGDLLYVVYGAAVAHGLNMEPIVDEIHRSNMTKFPAQYREDGKLLKRPNYTPPNLGRLVSRQMQLPF